MGVVRHIHVTVWEEDRGDQREPAVPKRERRAPRQKPRKLAPAAVSVESAASVQPVAPAPLDILEEGLTPTRLLLVTSMLRMLTTSQRETIRHKTFETVEGTVLTPGSPFKTDGGPYYVYLDGNGREHVKHLCITVGLRFIALCRSPGYEWIEAKHQDRFVRLFLSPLPSTTMVRGLVLEPYVIHSTYWQKSMQRAMERVQQVRAARELYALKRQSRC